MLHRLDLVLSDVSEECIASINRVSKINEVGTALAIISLKTAMASHPIRLHSPSSGMYLSFREFRARFWCRYILVCHWYFDHYQSLLYSVEFNEDGAIIQLSIYMHECNDVELIKNRDSLMALLYLSCFYES
jgi:hypothetical protein